MTTIDADHYDATPFGDALASRVVVYLKATRWYENLSAIVRAHRDYTGHGLFYDHTTERFYVHRTLDSLPMGEPLLSFIDEAAFSDWLSRQSDRSLSGYVPVDAPRFNDESGNQRLTRRLILDHIDHNRHPVD